MIVCCRGGSCRYLFSLRFARNSYAILVGPPQTSEKCPRLLLLLIWRLSEANRAPHSRCCCLSAIGFRLHSFLANNLVIDKPYKLWWQIRPNPAIFLCFVCGSPHSKFVYSFESLTAARPADGCLTWLAIYRSSRVMHAHQAQQKRPC